MFFFDIWYIYGFCNEMKKVIFKRDNFWKMLVKKCINKGSSKFNKFIIYY